MAEQKYRIGIGYDIHRLVENRDLIMPGQKLYIPKFERISEGSYE